MQKRSVFFRGFTLVELAIALGGLVLLALLGSTLLLLGLNRFYLAKEAISSGEALQNSSLFLRAALTQALQVDAFTGDLNTFNMPAGTRGRIRSYQSVADSGLTGTTRTIGVFLRENGLGESPSPSQLLPTGIFFTPPTATTSGVLFIDPGNGAQVRPSYDAIYVDRIVSLNFANLSPSTGPLRSMDVNIVARHFLNLDRSQWRWCPSALTPKPSNCTGAAYSDNTLTVRINFRNNAIPIPGTTQSTRIYGDLYFYKTILPKQTL